MPHGVRPPAQLTLVPARMRYASTILPFASKRIADDPAPLAAIDSEFETSTQPPSFERVGGLAVGEDVPRVRRARNGLPGARDLARAGTRRQR